MVVTVAFQGPIAQPPVRMHHAAQLDGLSHERHRRRSRGGEETSHPDPADTPAIFRRRHHDQGLLLRLPTPLTFFQTAKIFFDHLDGTGQPSAARLHHRPVQFMQPSLGCLIAPQAQPVQPQSTDTLLLSGHPPHGPEPSPERDVRVPQDGSRRHRNLATASRTLPENRTHRTSLGGTMARAAESFRAAELKQILPAGLLRADAGLELRHRPRGILHERACNGLWLPESSRYAHFVNSSRNPPNQGSRVW